MTNDEETKAAVAWLKRHGTKAHRDGMARFAIPSDKAFGVSMRNIQLLAKQLGKNHELAAALWATGWYEARMLAQYVDEPVRVTASRERLPARCSGSPIGPSITCTVGSASCSEIRVE